MVYAIITKMKLTFKKYFIPHDGNDNKPHILRIEAVIFILVVILGVETLFLMQSFVIQKRADFFATVLPSVLVDQTNDNRETAEIGTLKVNPLLEEAARLKAEDMANKEYFAHTSPDGQSPWYWLNEAGYKFSSAGENLAVNFIDSNDVTEAWMDSTGHRANILNGGFTEIGIAAAKGTYKGKQTTFVVQFFGKPVSSVAKAETQPTEPAPIKVDTKEEEVVVASADEEMFIEIQGVSVEEVPTEEVPIPNEIKINQSSIIQKTATMPTTTVNYLLTVLGTIMALALMLKVFIKIDIQHPPLIINGILLLIVIASTVLANQYISLIGTQIT